MFHPLHADPPSKAIACYSKLTALLAPFLTLSRDRVLNNQWTNEHINEINHT